MSIVKLELEVSSEELLKAVEQFNQPDLEKFVSQVIILHTQRKTTRLLKEEVDFFIHSHQNLYADTPSHCHQLISKTEKENLTEEEYRELIRLSEQIDKLQAQRLEYLAELAHLHGISLMELMQNLGFQT